MQKITVEMARKGLQAAIEEKGENYVYPDYNSGCYYAIDDAPACLVGNALSKIGAEYFEAIKDEEARGGDLLAIDEVESLTFEPAAVRALSRAQAAQDTGKTWGEALVKFELAL